MRRWNGWGDVANEMKLPDAAVDFLRRELGSPNPLQSAELSSVLLKVPPSRLIKQTKTDGFKLSFEAEVRLRHARGQSLPDWLALKSGEIGQFPDAVCYPENRQQIQSLLHFAQIHDIELIPYGGGTSVAGHINPNPSNRPQITVDMSHMNQLLAFDEISQIATFGAGTSGPMVEAQLRALGYTLGHFPQSFELSTIGGWIASRSSGQQSLRYGRIEQMFAGGFLETFDGSLELASFPASSAGPDLKEIALGSEGRFGILSEVKVRVHKLAEREKFAVLFFPDWHSASGFCKEIVQQKISLSMLRASNPNETSTQLQLAGQTNKIQLIEKTLRLLGYGKEKCMVTLGITGSKFQVRDTERQMKRIKRQFKGLSSPSSFARRWEENRFKLPYLREALWRKGFLVDTLETATNWSNVNNLMLSIESRLKSTLEENCCKGLVFTHLSHVYAQGSSLYTTFVFPVGEDFQSSLNLWKQLKHQVSQAVVLNGGTISHQHGVGKDHAPYLPFEKGALGMQVLSVLGYHFDPQKQLNPGTLLQD